MGKTSSALVSTRKKTADPSRESSSLATHPRRKMLCERLGFLREGTECFVDGKGKTSDEGSAGGCLPVLEEMLEGKHSFCL